MNLLRSFSWVGNVRELENTLERVVLINDIPILTDKEIGPILDESTQVNIPQSAQVSEPVPTSDQVVTSVAAPVMEEKAIDTSAVKTLKELEYEAILAGLSRTNWNMTLTAQQLGISRMTLYRKLDQHGLRNKD